MRTTLWSLILIPWRTWGKTERTRWLSQRSHRDSSTAGCMCFSQANVWHKATPRINETLAFTFQGWIPEASSFFPKTKKNPKKQANKRKEKKDENSHHKKVSAHFFCHAKGTSFETECDCMWWWQIKLFSWYDASKFLRMEHLGKHQRDVRRKLSLWDSPFECHSNLFRNVECRSSGFRPSLLNWDVS